MYDGPLGGIFWFVCPFEGEEEAWDFSETELLALPVPGKGEVRKEAWPCPDGLSLNSRRGDAFTHKETWRYLTRGRWELRCHSWNYFPRGRVELVNDKALIFLNPCILAYENYKEMLVKRFHLEGMKIRVIPDGSAHYRCHMDDRNIW